MSFEWFLSAALGGQAALKMSETKFTSKLFLRDYKEDACSFTSQGGVVI